MNEKNILKNKSNEEIAQVIFDEFVNEKVFRTNNIDRESSDYETKFWEKHEDEVHYDRQIEIEEIFWKKFQKLKKELKLKENAFLNKTSDEEIAEMIFDTLKGLTDLSTIDVSLFWNENGVEDVFDYPQTFYYRWERINNMAFQKIKVLKQQRKHEKEEQERDEALNKVDDIIEWAKEKGLKRVSKMNLKLYLSEKKMTLVPVNREALYLAVNNKISSI